jgi:hypothetical protein
MKKIYTFAVVCTAVVTLNAQRGSVAGPTLEYGTTSAQQTLSLPPYDTLGGPSWSGSGSPTIYSSQGGGFVCGTNGYADIQKAQIFPNTTPLYVVGAMYWFAAKTEGSGNPNSKITYRVYQCNGSGTDGGGNTVSTAPGTVSAFQDELLSAVDTGLSLATGANIWMLSSPVSTSSDFAIGFTMSGLAAGDTVGLVSSTDGDGGGADLAWEEWSDNTWHSFLDPNNWGLDLDMFILAIVDQNVGVNEYYHGLMMSQNYPNPAFSTTTINYSLETASENVILYVYDMNGKLVQSFDQGNQASGSYTIQLDVNNFAAGDYIFSLHANGTDLTKKMTITE